MVVAVSGFTVRQYPVGTKRENLMFGNFSISSWQRSSTRVEENG
jgi:hypothetical protein